MKQEFKIPKSVLVVVAAKTGEVLLLKRRDVDTFWQSVTGSLEHNEAPSTAATRELQEETGLTPTDGELVDCDCKWWYTIYPHWRHRYAEGVTKNCEHVFVFWVAKPINITLSAREHTEYQWLAQDEAQLKATSETNQRAIEKFI